MRKIIALSGITAAAAGIVIGLTAGTAHAAQSTAWVFAPTQSHSAPDQASPKISFYVKGDRLPILCSIEGKDVNGNNEWLRVQDTKGSAFISATAVTVQGPVTDCYPS